MAFLRSFGRRSDVLVYDPHKLSSPQVFLLTMVIFLIIVAFIAAILTRQISTAFSSNPGLNGLIIGVLAIGILLASSRSAGCSAKCAGSIRSAPAPKPPSRCCWRR